MSMRPNFEVAQASVANLVPVPTSPGATKPQPPALHYTQIYHNYCLQHYFLTKVTIPTTSSTIFNTLTAATVSINFTPEKHSIHNSESIHNDIY